MNREVPFNPKRAVIVHCDFRGRHVSDVTRLRWTYNISEMRWWLACLVVALTQAQPQLPPELLLLAKVKASIVDNLRRLPDYTCVETIERWQKSAPAGRLTEALEAGRGKFQLRDRVRLEVAYVAGKELYGLPGANKIDESEITRLVAGSIGNGTFAAFLESIFHSSVATFHFFGDAELEGRIVPRYDFQVSQLVSRYHLQSRFGEALVGYHGSFWLDPETLDLIRIQFSADDIPSILRLESASEVTIYGRVAIGNSRFLLPQTAEFLIADINGAVSRNRTSFQDCRQFTGESVLTFGDTTSGSPPPPQKTPAPVVKLPEDVSTEINLETSIDSESTAVGDPVEARLLRDFKWKHTTIIPARARLSGRVARLEKQDSQYFLELTFASLDFEGGHADLSKRRNDIFKLHQNNPGRRDEVATTIPLTFETDHLRLERGTRLVLRSRLLQSEEHDSIRP